LKQRKNLSVDIVLCPPAIHLEAFSKKIKNKDVNFGAQNIFWEERGSFTGEISAPMVKAMGASHVIVGHSERRKYFSETNEIANMKIKTALKSGLFPVYCVGETREERESGDIAKVLVSQLKEGLAEVPVTQISSVTIAYEPIWAVGSDNVPTSDEILEVKILLKKTLIEMYGVSAAEKVALLYGGSVKASIVDQVCNEPEMDGVLVGRESLIPQEFLKIAEAINNAIRNN
jgi:triosephosphate isomerase